MESAHRIDRTGCFSLAAAYKFAPLALRRSPAIFIPFLIFAGIELACLAVLYCAPRQPWCGVFGPPIRVFWGESFLHYPANFLLFPQLASLARTALYVLIGSLLNGIAVLFVSDMCAGEAGRPVVWRALRRYAPLFMVSLASTAVFMIFVRVFSACCGAYFSQHASLLWIPARVWLGPVVFLVNLLTGITVQAFFIYAAPALMIDNAGFFRSVGRSVRLCRSMFPQTAALILVPVLVYVPIMVLQYKTPFFVNLYPESVVFIAAAGSIINSLIVDVLVTVSITYLYLTVDKQ